VVRCIRLLAHLIEPDSFFPLFPILIALDVVA
jgi:hypothetical protein